MMLGSTISHYRIIAKLGEGGMGEVYRATDTKLERDVAIKVLPRSFAADSARLARFDREAKVLAALNHPNIAVIYGVEQSAETHALIMELVEGETLGERLRRASMTVPEALDCCRQIALALEAAHDKGITHGDLKPENVKIDVEGRVKVLDFGLAKEVANPTSSADQAESPTLTHMTTLPGERLGTAPYMSPEQARARPVDKRSDIWSFGCVLYECLTGKPMFGGEDVTETLASIIKGEPDWAALPEDTPPTIHLLLRKYLRKDRKRRLHDIADARIDIEQTLGDPVSSIIWPSEGALRETQIARGIPRLRVAGLVLGVAFLALALGWFLKPVPVPAPPPARHAELVLSGPYRFSAELGNDSFALSPDGRRLIYSYSRADQGSGLRVLDLASGEDKPIPGAERVQVGHPFFSPDGSRFGYLLGDDLMTMPIRGGTPIPLGIGEFIHLSLLGFGDADWSEQGDIVFATTGEPLRMVSKDDGEPKAVTVLNQGEAYHAFPQFLPGGTRILFVVITWEGGDSLVGHLEVVDIATGQRKELGVEKCYYARYSPSGHLLFVTRNGELFAVAFDPKRSEATGEPKRMLEGVAVSQYGWAQFDVADDGTLIYVTGEDLASKQNKTLAWIDPNGQSRPFTQEHGPGTDFDLSPDEERVALTINGDIWILDKTQKDNEKLRVLVHDETPEYGPRWSKDGEWIYFASAHEGKSSIWNKEADYSEEPAQLVWEAPFTIAVEIVSASDIIFDHPSGGGNGSFMRMELWRLPLKQENATPEPVLKKSDVAYSNPALSPNGKWLAYASTEEGGAPRVYVRALHGSTESEKVSDGPGRNPCWSRTGDQIFYQWGADFFSSPVVEQEGRPVAGKAVPVGNFKWAILSSPWNNSWTVAGEDNRILALVDADEVGLGNREEARPARSTEPTHLDSIFNWFTELNKEVPPTGAR